MSDITEADYRAITDMAHELHTRIHYLMARTEGPRDTAWNELYELMQLAHVIGTAAARYADRAALSPEPVDYLPASAEVPPVRDIDRYQPVDWVARLAGAHDRFPGEW